jgi:ATP-dependent exoDNAse (exonuclease V) beta subunit
MKKVSRIACKKKRLGVGHRATSGRPLPFRAPAQPWRTKYPIADGFEQEITKLCEAREQEREARRLESSLSPQRGRRLSNISLERFRTSIKYQARPAEVTRDAERPAGARFGALVHATLATVPLDANTDEVQQIAALYARVLGADERETAAAAAAVDSTLTHPLLLRAREAVAFGQCRRETPITLTLSDGTVVEGVLDLAFLEKDSWIVVDFKIDRELEEGLQQYEKQIRLYAAAISRSTGKSTSAILISV